MRSFNDLLISFYSKRDFDNDIEDGWCCCLTATEIYYWKLIFNSALHQADCEQSLVFRFEFLLVEVSFPFLFTLCGVVRVAGAFAYIGSLRDGCRLGFLAWGAQGEHGVYSRVLEIYPVVQKKILWYIFACIATSANVRDANDFERAKNHVKEISAGRETTLLTCSVVLTGWWIVKCIVNCYHFHDEIIWLKHLEFILILLSYLNFSFRVTFEN